MDYNFLTTKPDQVSSATASVIPEAISDEDIPAKVFRDGGQVFAGLFPSREEVMAECNCRSTRGSEPGGHGPLNSSSTEVYTQSTSPSTRASIDGGMLR